jgi:predicted flap endonuclease-1-like 5' DNA nuclease
MAGIVGIIFFVVAMWLWNLNPSGWLFVVVITIFNLIFLGLALIGQTSFNDIMLQLGINALALILALIPSTKQAFLPAPPTPEQVKAATDAAADKRVGATAKVAATTAAAADRAAAAADSAADSAAVAAKAAADTVDDAVDATADAVGDAAAATADAVGDAAKATGETVSDAFSRVTGITLTDEQIAEIGGKSLTEIEGIGPKISETLNAAGINTFLDLAVTPVDDLRKILADAGLRADPSTWPEQATLAASGNWEDLKKLQDNLTGGRRT